MDATETRVNKSFWRLGEPYVWATGLALSVVLLLTAILIYVVIANGITIFWPKPVALATLKDNSVLMGEITQVDEASKHNVRRFQFKVGNRDLYGMDFRWVDEQEITRLAHPAEALVLERTEYGNFYGFLKSVGVGESAAHPAEGKARELLAQALRNIQPAREALEQINEQVAALNYQIERLENKLAKLRFRGLSGSQEFARLNQREKRLKEKFARLTADLGKKRQELLRHQALFVDAAGIEKTIPLAHIVRFTQPNRMGVGDKLSYYFTRVKELLLDEPRESNTEGGLFPAIFGTVMLTILMSLFSFPIGVVAGIYLREYAREGVLVKMVRIAVNNLAGVPSIVYGIFGLGFFVYGIGSTIDQFFFPERLPTPTFGTGGILWASLTLALLTVPVVIVATEEALGAIPPGIREGSQALAATKFQTLVNLLLPMASPGILTGFILAMARAAGEVAPLMITGVVKLAPALPIDGHFPYLHLDRKFMHLGFHIYDIGFQSPNVEAAKPMVYVTTLLLILIVLIMTSLAISLRNRMRKRYAVMDV